MLDRVNGIPNVVAGFDYMQMSNGSGFFVEHYDLDLLSLISSWTMTASDIARMIRPIATALDDMHGRRIIHRNVRLDSLLVKKGPVKGRPELFLSGFSRCVEIVYRDNRYW